MNKRYISRLRGDLYEFQHAFKTAKVCLSPQNPFVTALKDQLEVQIRRLDAHHQSIVFQDNPLTAIPKNGIANLIFLADTPLSWTTDITIDHRFYNSGDVLTVRITNSTLHTIDLADDLSNTCTSVNRSLFADTDFIPNFSGSPS